MINASVNASSEVVGLFAGREAFEAAVNALLAAGFERTDLSVLGSHESIDAAGRPGKPWKDVLTALVGEIKYEVPLVASGAIVLAGGATAALIGALIGAAVGGAVVKDVIEEVTSTPDTEDFARAVEAGSVILWVRAPDQRLERAAIDILQRNGATNVHVHRHAGAAAGGKD